MNIRQKMFLGAAALTLIPVTLMALLLWQNASSLADKALDERVRAQMQSLRDTKAEQLKDEINGRIADLRALAAQRSTIEAMRAFKSAAATVAKDAPGDGAMLSPPRKPTCKTTSTKNFKSAWAQPRRRPWQRPPPSAMR